MKARDMLQELNKICSACFSLVESCTSFLMLEVLDHENIENNADNGHLIIFIICN